MNCEDLEELISSYADGELVGVQRDFVEEHLNGCADCQSRLADYRKTGERLLSLRVMPSIPDIKQAIMSKIKEIRTPVKLRRWLRPVMVVIPIIIILAIVLPLQLSGSSSSYKSVIAKAYAAVEKLESYRYTKDEYNQLSETDEPVNTFHVDFEYVSPDRYHITSEVTEEDTLQDAMRSEEIVIGNQMYTNYASPYLMNIEYYERFTPTQDRTLGLLNLLTEIDTMPDQIIDGTDCYHYAGAVDMEKFMEKFRLDFELDWEQIYSKMLGKFPGIKIDKEQIFEGLKSNYLSKAITFEFWIGKDDYLIRQAKIIYQALPHVYSGWYRYKSISILKYDKFNEPILIQPPLNESGELLDGWVVYTLEE